VFLILKNKEKLSARNHCNKRIFNFSVMVPIYQKYSQKSAKYLVIAIKKFKKFLS